MPQCERKPRAPRRIALVASPYVDAGAWPSTRHDETRLERTGRQAFVLNQDLATPNWRKLRIEMTASLREADDLAD